MVNRYRYTPFGGHELVSESALPSTLLNWAREWDREVHLLYVRNRWYEPGTGRFTSEDPLGLSGGINFYVYAENDPINRTDPFGLAPCDPAHSRVIEASVETGVVFTCAQRRRGGGAYVWSPSSRGSNASAWGHPTGGFPVGGMVGRPPAAVTSASPCGMAVGNLAVSAGLDYPGIKGLRAAASSALMARQLTAQLKRRPADLVRMPASWYGAGAGGATGVMLGMRNVHRMNAVSSTVDAFAPQLPQEIFVTMAGAGDLGLWGWLPGVSTGAAIFGSSGVLNQCS